MTKIKKTSAYKEGENTVSADFVEKLHKKGIPSAKFEPIYKVFTAGKKTTAKPDIHFTNGCTHIISAKMGGTDAELKAFSTAVEYSNNLKNVINLGMVFGVCYPPPEGGKYHVHIVPIRPGEEHLAATFDTLEELASFIKDASEGLKEEIKKKIEPPDEGATRLLRVSAMELAKSIKGIPFEKLEIVFGGSDFFESVLKHRLKEKEREETLRMGAAFLYVNQLVFYLLISRAAERGGKQEEFPPIDPGDYSSPEKINEKYFSLVRKKDYEPIYGFNVAQFFTGKTANEANLHVVRAITGLAPTLEQPDITGQIFQTLIPLELRKPLGAHYTNPKAAELLAKFAISDSEDTVLDPSCGSGTLLIAAYRRKMKKAKEDDKTKIHRRFVEEQITGIDAMAFSSHLAAVNLALQQPLMETNSVRIATADSTIQRPREMIRSFRGTLPDEFKQAAIDFDYFAPRKKIERKGGPVSMREGEREAFLLDKVDVVIMNPPFTSWDNMSKSYRNALTTEFCLKRAAYRKIIYWKISQQAFFIMLADTFLKNGGALAAVLPLTTFTGVAFKYLVSYLTDNYTIDYIFVGMGRSSYSEDTNLTECLFVSRKKKPLKNHKVTIVGTINNPTQWTTQEIRSIHRAAVKGEVNENVAIVKKFPQTALAMERESLTGLVLRLTDVYENAMNTIANIEPENPLKSIGEQLNSRKMDINRWVLGSEHLPYYGPRALLICRTEKRALKEDDRLVYEKKSGAHYVFRDRIGNACYKIKKEDVRSALRRFSYFSSIDVSRQTDMCIANPTEDMERIMIAFYGKRDAEKYMERIKKTTKKFHGGQWFYRVNSGSSRLCIVRRIDLSASGTTVLACWNENNMFLTGDGFFLKNSQDQKFEKLLCLWLNSSYSIAKLMEHMTITRGSWMKFEKSSIMALPMVDASKLTEKQRKRVEVVFERLQKRIGHVCWINCKGLMRAGLWWITLFLSYLVLKAMKEGVTLLKKSGRVFFKQFFLYVVPWVFLKERTGMITDDNLE